MNSFMVLNIMATVKSRATEYICKTVEQLLNTVQPILMPQMTQTIQHDN